MVVCKYKLLDAEFDLWYSVYVYVCVEGTGEPGLKLVVRKEDNSPPFIDLTGSGSPVRGNLGP